MNNLKMIGSFLLIVIMFLTCSKPTEPNRWDEGPVVQETGIPDFIIAKSDSFIISKVGPTYFADYIIFDSVRSRYYPPDSFCISHPSSCSNYLRYPNYLMVYTFKIPEKPWIDELIEFAVDSVGNIIAERSPYGIPECLSNPSCCIFGIDSSMAVNLAKQSGLEDGIKPWQASFYWFGGTINKYVWCITNYLTEFSGECLILDSNSGIVLEKSDWMTMP